MHEQLAEQSFQICLKLSKLTARAFFNGVKKLNDIIKQNRQDIVNGVKESVSKLFNHEDVKGKQSVADLVGQGEGVSSIELDQVKGFDKTARKYGIDYAVRKDRDGKYLVFFKGKDADALTAAFSEFTSKKLNRSERPSLKERLAKAKERMAEKENDKLKLKKKEAIDR